MGELWATKSVWFDLVDCRPGTGPVERLRRVARIQEVLVAIVTDPVCGMCISPATAAARRGTDHGTVYFCSPDCAATFDANPHRNTTPAAKSPH